MISRVELSQMTLGEILSTYPFTSHYFDQNKLEVINHESLSLESYLKGFNLEEIESGAMDLDKLEVDLLAYIEQMLSFLGIKSDNAVKNITILAGQDKSGQSENFEAITISKGDIVSIVGPTGSGKSRLLADIEWTANRDTPTKRGILINGKLADPKWRFSSSNKLVAQLSQNMNFVMDLSVKEFLELHAMSRMVEDIDDVIQKILSAANELEC
jgi:hypothetical protein